MITLDDIQAVNPNTRFFSIDDPRFRLFGRVVDEYDFTELISYAIKTCKPGDAVTYEGSVSEMESFSIKQQFEKDFYGEMKCQIGWCHGRNNKMNAMEWHKGSELLVAATDLMLILGKIYDIENNTYDSSLAEVCFVPQGTAVEIYGTTMHFAPLNIHEDGFVSLIILPGGTNTPLEESSHKDPLLFQKNKWIIAHESSKPASNGAHVGIKGGNITITIPKSL
jgi:hypothetical protein